MNVRILGTAVALIGILSLCLLAQGSFTADLGFEVTFDPNGPFIADMGTTFELGYAAGPVQWASYSDCRLTVGYLWQEFGMDVDLDAFAVHGDILFGPSTADYLYAQVIAEMTFLGVDVGFYWAQLGDAVLGGPADGSALRIAARFAGLEVVSTTEIGARIEGDGFAGIDIVHASTGLYRHYETNPRAAGQGFTGEKLRIGGFGFGCIGNVDATLYFTCQGFDFLSFEVDEVTFGIPWLNLGLELTYELQTKSLAMTPTFVVGDELICFRPHFAVRLGTTSWAIEGFELGALEVGCSWNGITIKDLTVLDTGRFVITAEDDGSTIETLDDAIDRGHDFYVQYRELLSIEITFDGCCGSTDRILLNTYFADTSVLFDWAMSYLEMRAGVSSDIAFSLAMTVMPGKIDAVELGFTLHW